MTEKYVLDLVTRKTLKKVGNIEFKTLGFWNQVAWVWILALQFTSEVTLGKPVDLIGLL